MPQWNSDRPYRRVSRAGRIAAHAQRSFADAPGADPMTSRRISSVRPCSSPARCPKCHPRGPRRVLRAPAPRRGWGVGRVLRRLASALDEFLDGCEADGAFVPVCRHEPEIRASEP